MITRIPFGDCYCIWAEPNQYSKDIETRKVGVQINSQPEDSQVHTPLFGYLTLALGSYNHKVGYPKKQEKAADHPGRVEDLQPGPERQPRSQLPAKARCPSIG